MDFSGFVLISGQGDGEHTACLMSARSLLDDRPFNDQHPSATLRTIGIRINDGPWWEDAWERTFLLLPFALDERLCANKCDVSRATEKERAKLCAKWALSWAVPFTFDQAALAMESAKLPTWAVILREHAAKLRTEPTKKNAACAVRAVRAASNAYAAGNACVAVGVHVAYAGNAVAAAHAALVADAPLDGDDDSAANAAVLAHAYAYACATANLAYEKIRVRDALIDLFDRLLDVGYRHA